jgi:hypothetical protein
MANKDELKGKMEELSEQQDDVEDQLWKINFDGASCREGAGVGVWINRPKGDSKFVPTNLFLNALITWPNMKR